MDVRRLDLADRTSTLDFARRLRDDYTFDALVNNAGLLEKEPFGDLTLDAWDRTFQVNVTAPLTLAKEIGLHMPRGGSIVNIASTDAYIGSFRGIA